MLIQKGQHLSVSTEIKKGQHLSSKTEFKKGENLGNTNGAKKGELGRNFKGGVIYNYQGRKLVYSPQHPYCDGKGYVRNYRLVCESYLKRYLLPTEIVHHINHNATDDSPTNLYVFASKSEHSYFHWHPIDLKSNLF